MGCMAVGCNDMSSERSGLQLDAIQPIVLVGGRSERFGRDKLREPMPFGTLLLVERPIEALRSVFGPRVKLVGACHESVAVRGDGVLIDCHPGIGPLGGIVSALEACGSSIFVLAGDMPSCDSAMIHAILEAAARAPASVLAVLAMTDQLHPCVGIYFRGALEPMRAQIRAGAFALARALPDACVLRVPCSPRAVANVNTRDEMPSE